MHIRKCFKNPLQRDRSRAGWKRYVWMPKNQICVVQVSVPVAKGCLGHARSLLLAAVLRLQDGVWKCSGNMWCSTSMDFICRDLNPYRLCTVWDRREKWLVFYPYVWAKTFRGWIRLLCCGWDACFWSSALEESTTKQFHPVVCCMWRQYLTAAWWICLCPSSKGLDNYALGPRLLDFMCCRQFGHIFLVWYQLQRDRFHTLPLNWHQDGVPGVWCLRVYHHPIIYHSKMIILISKYFLKDVVKKDKFTLTFKSQFCNLPEIRCQSFEIPFKFTFHVVFPSHKTTFFVATHTGDQFNFITTQPKSSDSSSPPTQAINYDR